MMSRAGTSQAITAAGSARSRCKSSTRLRALGGSGSRATAGGEADMRSQRSQPDYACADCKGEKLLGARAHQRQEAEAAQQEPDEQDGEDRSDTIVRPPGD